MISVAGLSVILVYEMCFGHPCCDEMVWKELKCPGDAGKLKSVPKLKVFSAPDKQETHEQLTQNVK